MTSERVRSKQAATAFVIAAVAGVVHGAFSLYWGIGGSWLVETLGADLVEIWEDNAILLVPVGLVKIAAAVIPLLLLTPQGGWLPGLLRRIIRGISWAGGILLILWGGVNTVSGNLVLSGILEPDGGYDRDGMIGHAWLWDPLFLVWGIALVAGLLLGRRRSR
ncbi:MAG TPA: DUF3995 domain-containing protein [Candidatus Corynebacterium avicola]|uniref:DUF3995 domain-containing protein n=1 Tax=Candidatus Corynebacterium avicola TaxID=2838527 RepID=A0A9D1RRF4_9CORY|nr:DUF3995 domain-containing protein [Candidatus Corynebacterium avicola]